MDQTFYRNGILPHGGNNVGKSTQKSGRNRAILHLSKDGWSCAQIGELHGLTMSRVRQIIAREAAILTREIELAAANRAIQQPNPLHLTLFVRNAVADLVGKEDFTPQEVSEIVDLMPRILRTPQFHGCHGRELCAWLRSAGLEPKKSGTRL
jgi:hypothetical protein